MVNNWFPPAAEPGVHGRGARKTADTGGKMQRDRAETIGLQALAHVAGQDELMAAFLAATGADLAEIRGKAADPLFLGAVLDFLLQDDRWVIGFAEAAGLHPADPGLARAALPGGQQPHWT